MSTLAWVVGRGGLLGSCVERAVSSEVWHPARPLVWGASDSSRHSITEAVLGFQSYVRSTQCRSWRIYWCAGKGVVGTTADDLAAETETFRFFLERLGIAFDASAPPTRGCIFLASSAGGVYAGSSDQPSTETTPAQPISDYGRAKLTQEGALREWACHRPSVSTLIGRLSNLYGPGQRVDKPQGLISHMSRCSIFGMPVQIYVSLDTIRDYLFAEDAGRHIVDGVLRLDREEQTQQKHVIKIYSSGNETTVAGLIGVFRQIAKRQLRVVLGLSSMRSLQPARLRFRSIVWSDEGTPRCTELLDGVSRLHRYQLALFQAGKLPAPALGSRR